MIKVAKVLAVLLFVPSMLHARGLIVGPSQLGIIGKPGDVVSGVITVSSSRSDQQNDVRVTLEDFTRNERGEVVYLDMAGSRSARQWLDVDQTSFTTHEGESIQIRVTAKIPQNASGSYWALVNFAAVPPKPTTSGSKTAVGIQTVPSVGIPVVVTALDGSEKVDVQFVETKGVRTKDSNVIECEATVENQGTLAILISGAFALEKKTADGDEELASVDISPLTSLPGTKLKLKGTIPVAGNSGGTQVHTYLVYGENSGQGTESVTPVTESQSGK